MKTVTGKIVSSTPVPISKAAYIMSQFVTAETGASQAVGAYLRRATTAFDELVRLHTKPDRGKHKKHKSDISATTVTEEKVSSQSAAEVSQGPSRERKKEKEKVDFENSVGHEARTVIEAKEEKKEKKKKGGDFGNNEDGDGRMEIEIKEESNLEEENVGKKHKRKNTERDNFEENQNKMGIKQEENRVDGIGKFEGNGERMETGEEKKEKRKKRKSREVGEESRNEVEEEQGEKKKKKRRRGGEEDN